MVKVTTPLSRNAVFGSPTSPPRNTGKRKELILSTTNIFSYAIPGMPLGTESFQSPRRAAVAFDHDHIIFPDTPAGSVPLVFNIENTPEASSAVRTSRKRGNQDSTQVSPFTKQVVLTEQDRCIEAEYTKRQKNKRNNRKPNNNRK